MCLRCIVCGAIQVCDVNVPAVYIEEAAASLANNASFFTLEEREQVIKEWAACNEYCFLETRAEDLDHRSRRFIQPRKITVKL